MKRTGLRRRTPLAGRRPGNARGGGAAGRALRTARKLRTLRASVEEGTLSAWETELLSETSDGLPERLERFGRAFRDPGLADSADPQGPLSMRQSAKVREIERDIARRERAK